MSNPPSTPPGPTPSGYPENGQQPQYPVNGQQPQYPANGQQPQYPVNGQQQYGQPPVKKKTGRNIGIGCGIIVLIIILIASCSAIVSGGGDDSAATGTEETQAAAAAPVEEAAADESVAAGGLGEAVAAGDLAITVSAAEGGIESAGMEGLEEAPSGQFYRVDLEIANNGTEPASLMSSEFMLVDGNGSSYGATDMVVEDGVLIYEDLNPGNTYTGVLYFDIPAEVAPATLQFESTFTFDGPVEISLQ